MSFDITLQENIGNEIGLGIKTFNVVTLNITNGLLKKGDYYIPVEHILFIKEI